MFILTFFMAMLTTIAANSTCTSWQECIANKRTIMGEAAYQLIMAQHDAFKNNRAPKIADPCIKNIPIIESHEAMVDIRSYHHPRIIMLPDPAKPFASPDHNSGFAAASKVRATVYTHLNTVIEKLDMLAPAFGYEPGQITIKVFEGLRSLQTQAMLFDNKAQEIRQANPSMTEDEIFNETAKWVAPIRNNVPVHSTGGAIDMRLWDTHVNQFLDMGPFGAIWGKNTTAPTFSEDLTDLQKNNRLLLLIAVAQAGLVNYAYEFWHFSSGDRYASFWLEDDAAQRKALYDAVN